MNRQQRRQQNRRKHGSKPMSSKEAVLADLQRNGITTENLSKVEDMAFKRGFDKGMTVAGEPLLRTLYAGICLALNDLYGFGKKRCKRTLMRTEEYIRDTLTSDEAEDAVFKRMGYRIDYADPFNRIQDELEN